MASGNFLYLSSLSGIFRLFTVKTSESIFQSKITGIPAIVLAWIAYFLSSWTDVFPEILAILAVEKSILFDRAALLGLEENIEQEISTSSSSSSSSSSSLSSSEEIDIISDREEEYLDDILLQTLLYEKFFIGVVCVVFLLSAAYLLLRVLSKHKPDSPYEIMFDFIFHVICALALLTGSGLVLLSAAKIQNFVDQIDDRDGFAPPEIVEIIQKNKDHVQDKADKIAAAVMGMLNGIFYVLCVITIRMTDPIKCKRKSNKKKVRKWNSMNVAGSHDAHRGHHQNYNDMPVFLGMANELQNQNNPAYGSYGFFGGNVNNNSYIYDLRDENT